MEDRLIDLEAGLVTVWCPHCRKMVTMTRDADYELGWGNCPECGAEFPINLET